MQAAGPTPSYCPAVGDRFRVNSFDLGFINIHPADVLITVTRIDEDSEEMELALLPLPGGEQCSTYLRVQRWFIEEYPRRTPMNCWLKNAMAFLRFIEMGVLVSEESKAAKE